jgi:ubiquinone/menaquinone biosynthesis C-methylase UbiE
LSKQTEVAKFDSSALKTYWSDLSQKHLDESGDDLAVICFAGMPYWFNHFYALYQRKAMERLLQGKDFSGARVLDVGTGLGRWARWFSQWPDTDVVGIDIEPERLEVARRHGGAQFLEMPVDDLAFPAQSFDVVNSVTVLQHVGHDTKRVAIAEFGRILRPGGRAVIFEETDNRDDSPHIFSWPNQEFQAEFAKNGFVLERSVGDQYAPILRLMKSAYVLTRGKRARGEIDRMKFERSGPASSFMHALRLGVMLSYPVEEVARFLPPRLGRIRGYLFRKL